MPPQLTLTPREYDVLQLTALDRPVKEIGATLGICRDTVWRYRQEVMGKLNVSSPVGLALAAVACGVVTVEPRRGSVVVTDRRKTLHR